MAFVDVPGHERFVKNMLAGVGGIDAVAARHRRRRVGDAADARAFRDLPAARQVRAGLIALTKADLVDADTLELARLDARELVAGSALADAPDRRRVGEDRRGARRAAGRARARSRPRVPARAAAGAPRLPIDRVFSMRGFGTVVTGTLTSGTIRAGRGAGAAAVGAPRQGARPAGARRGAAVGRRGTASRRQPRRRRRRRHQPRRYADRARARSTSRAGSTRSSICCPTRSRCATARACAFITARRSCSAAWRWPRSARTRPDHGTRGSHGQHADQMSGAGALQPGRRVCARSGSKRRRC